MNFNDLAVPPFSLAKQRQPINNCEFVINFTFLKANHSFTRYSNHQLAA